MKEFLSKGRGRGEEEQRLSEVSLLGALVFLRDLIVHTYRQQDGQMAIQETIRKLCGDVDSIHLEVLAKEKAGLQTRLDDGAELSDAQIQRLNDLNEQLTNLDTSSRTSSK